MTTQGLSPLLSAGVTQAPQPAPPPPAAVSPDRSAAACARIMMVDDELINTKAVETHLAIAGFQNFCKTTDDTTALKEIVMQQPDVLLLDIMMPHVNGLDILAALRQCHEFAQMPVLILTSMDDQATKAQALDLGATDFLTKPVDPAELVARVRNAVALKSHYDNMRRYAAELERQVQLRTAELATSRLEVIHCLARAAEYRDNETGRHVIRVGRYAGIIARQLGLDAERVELIEHAAPLHDVGKIGIPDAVLLKPGRLDDEERKVIEKHCFFGEGIVGGLRPAEWASLSAHIQMGVEFLETGRSPLLQMAATIAMSHHERWDGTGYPRGLKGEAIPLEGRITAVADVFDALGSRRPYKEPFTNDKCFQILREGRGTHFDPSVLDAFFAREEEILQVKRELADP